MSNLSCARCSQSVLEAGLKTALGDDSKLLYCPKCFPIIELSILEKNPVTFSTEKKSSNGKNSMYGRRFQDQINRYLPESDYSVFVASTIRCDLKKTELIVTFQVVDENNTEVHRATVEKPSPTRLISKHDADGIAVIESLRFMESIGCQDDIITVFTDSQWLMETMFKPEYVIHPKSRHYPWYSEYKAMLVKFPEILGVWIPATINPVSPLFSE